MRGRLQRLGPQGSILGRRPRHILRLNHFQQLGTMYRQHVRQQKDLPQTYCVQRCNAGWDPWIGTFMTRWVDCMASIPISTKRYKKQRHPNLLSRKCREMQRNSTRINAQDVYPNFLGYRSISTFTIFDIAKSSAISLNHIHAETADEFYFNKCFWRKQHATTLSTHLNNHAKQRRWRSPTHSISITPKTFTLKNWCAWIAAHLMAMQIIVDVPQLV